MQWHTHTHTFTLNNQIPLDRWNHIFLLQSLTERKQILPNEMVFFCCCIIFFFDQVPLLVDGINIRLERNQKNRLIILLSVSVCVCCRGCCFCCRFNCDVIWLIRDWRWLVRYPAASSMCNWIKSWDELFNSSSSVSSDGRAAEWVAIWMRVEMREWRMGIIHFWLCGRD